MMDTATPLVNPIDRSHLDLQIELPDSSFVWYESANEQYTGASLAASITSAHYEECLNADSRSRESLFLRDFLCQAAPTDNRRSLEPTQFGSTCAGILAAQSLAASLLLPTGSTIAKVTGSVQAPFMAVGKCSVHFSSLNIS